MSKKDGITKIVVDMKTTTDLLAGCEDLLNELGALETNIFNIKNKIIDMMDTLEEVTYSGRAVLPADVKSERKEDGKNGSFKHNRKRRRFSRTTA